MRKMRICLGLALCLFVLFSGVTTLGGPNVVHAVALPMISAYPSLINLGDQVMGASFSTSFTVSLSPTDTSNSVMVYMYPDQCYVSPSNCYVNSYISTQVMVSGNAPQTFGEFYRTVRVSGPANMQQVVVKGNALYPAPTNASLVYNSATGENHFHCDPVPGATSYSVLIINMGGGLTNKHIATKVFTSNDATFTLTLPTSSGLRFSVTAKNADGTKRSMTTVLTPITVQ